jgi:hypothetical protein
MTPLDAIFSRFRFVSKRDISPLCSKRGTRDTLGDVYADAGFTTGAEIGVRAGNYSKIICSKVPGVKYTCIDPWTQHNSISNERQDLYFKAAKENLSSFNVTFLKTTSMEALKNIGDAELDFVYIDGDHLFDYVITDIVFWAKKVKRGGIVAVHDYCNCYRGGVIKAVDAYVYCHKIDPWFVTGELMPTAFWVNP